MQRADPLLIIQSNKGIDKLDICSMLIGQSVSDCDLWGFHSIGILGPENSYISASFCLSPLWMSSWIISGQFITTSTLPNNCIKSISFPNWIRDVLSVYCLMWLQFLRISFPPHAPSTFSCIASMHGSPMLCCLSHASFYSYRMSLLLWGGSRSAGVAGNTAAWDATVTRLWCCPWCLWFPPTSQGVRVDRLIGLTNDPSCK